MDIPDGLRYTPEHEWVRIDDGEAVVGITDFAQDSLGDIVYVSLPEVGAVIDAAESVAEVESTKSVSEIYAPLAGTVAAVNDALAEQPELVNRDPYGAGWILRIRLVSAEAPDGSASLLDAVAYRALVE